jgi:hypothetical protein
LIPNECVLSMNLHTIIILTVYYKRAAPGYRGSRKLTCWIEFWITTMKWLLIYTFILTDNGSLTLNNELSNTIDVLVIWNLHKNASFEKLSICIANTVCKTFWDTLCVCKTLWCQQTKLKSIFCLCWPHNDDCDVSIQKTNKHYLYDLYFVHLTNHMPYNVDLENRLTISNEKTWYIWDFEYLWRCL